MTPLPSALLAKDTLSYGTCNFTHVFSNHKNMVLPMTEHVCSKHICLPIFPSLDTEDAKYIAETLLKII